MATSVYSIHTPKDSTRISPTKALAEQANRKFTPKRRDTPEENFIRELESVASDLAVLPKEARPMLNLPVLDTWVFKEPPPASLTVAVFGKFAEGREENVLRIGREIPGGRPLLLKSSVLNDKTLIDEHIPNSIERLRSKIVRILAIAVVAVLLTSALCSQVL